MLKKALQLPLSLGLKDDATFHNFYAGKNLEIITELQKTAQNQGEKIIYLCGARGQGCSHLLQACCHFAHHHHLSSVYLPLAQLVMHPPEMLNGLETLDLICIDDLQVIANNKAWEEAIFHLYNRIFDQGKNLIIAASDLPKSLQLSLPDLESRLAFSMLYQLHSLNDEEKIAALIMRAHRRGIHLSEEVGKYILNHCPRHMHTLFAALDILDKASLAAQRRLTIPFVKEILEI